MSLLDSLFGKHHARQALEQALDAVVSIDERNDVTFYNAAAEALWGWRCDEVLGKPVKMLLPQLNLAGLAEQANKARRDIELVRKDGRKLWVRLSLSGVKAGGKTRYTVFLQDISREHEAQTLLSQTLEQALDAVVMVNEQSLVTFFNPAAERLWGYRREDVMGQPAHLLLPVSLPALLADQPGNARRELCISRRDGSSVWVQLSLTQVRLEGPRLNYTAFVQDMSAEVAQRERAQMLSPVAEETEHAVIITDALGLTQYVNRGFERLTGYWIY